MRQECVFIAGFITKEVFGTEGSKINQQKDGKEDFEKNKVPEKQNEP